MKKVWLVLICLLPIWSEAKVVEILPVSVSTGMDPWAVRLSQEIREMKKNSQFPVQGYAECARTKELSQVLLCFYSDASAMNTALVRASIFSEGSDHVPAGTLVRFSHEDYSYNLKHIYGHDIQSDALAGFYEKAQSLCSESHGDPDICLSHNEKEIFETLILPSLQEHKPLVLLSVMFNTRVTYIEVASHEIMHAQYFLTPEYREITDRFWQDDLSEDERQKVRSLLVGYDTTNDSLMRNEFQAFVLQEKSDHGVLKSIAPLYREALMGRLKRAGFPPIQVEGDGTISP